MTDLISTEPCPCGHRSCKRVHLVGSGVFFQGSGFTAEEAQEICTAVNSRRRARAAKAARRDGRHADPITNLRVDVDSRVVFHHAKPIAVYLRCATGGERYVDPAGRRGRQVVAEALAKLATR